MRTSPGIVLLLVSLAGCESRHIAARTAQDDAFPAAALAAYVDVQRALAADDLDSARAALGRLRTSTSGPLGEQAGRAASGADLDAVRREFKRLSADVVARGIPEGYISVMCPMFDGGNARWLQKRGQLANPYFGRAMPMCGTIEKRPAGP